MKCSILCILSFCLFTLPSAFAVPSAEELLKQAVTVILTDSGLEDEEGKTFARELLASPEWQRELMDSGPVTAPENMIEILLAIWKSDRSLASRPVDRKMATACALEGPRRNWNADVMLPRYEFFRDKWKSGWLNAMYENLSVFERRFLARGVQHGGFNSLESMEYHNQEVALPAEKYTGACWYARWILHNPFGDSIHGPLYYAPFHDSWDNYAEVVRNVGGVCGSLSNFGAAAALANGIPAVTMGEPGHCAYTVMIKPGQWQPAYSLSWQRGMHTTFYGSSWGWHVLNAKAQEDIPATRKSADLRRLAKFQLEAKQPEKAREAMQLARAGHPLDWVNWEQSVEILTDTEASAEDWQALHQDVIKHLAPVSGEAAFQLLQYNIYPKVLPDDVAKRSKVLLTFQQAVQDWGLGQWNFGGALNHQVSLLGSDVKAQDDYMAATFGAHAAKNAFTGEILSTQMSRVGDDQKRLQNFIAQIGKTLAKDGGGDFTQVIEMLARTVLPDAAKRGDKATFQFVGQLTAKNYEPHTIKPEPFPGILLSSGGTFGIQKPGNRWDVPSRHWGVIEEHGGDFHTDSKPATATIQLGNFGQISGIVIVTRGGNFHRLNAAILQTSIDGTNWVDAHTFSKAGQVHRIDLADKKIDAGYVRVFQPHDPSLHFHKFLVYGQKKN